MRRLVLLLVALLLLSGCVWTRLLDLKGQFKDFDHYIDAVDDGPALVLRFKEPCLQPDDIGYLLDGEPSQRLPREGGGWWWNYHLRRDRADSIGLDLTIGTDGKMADSLRVPPEVLSFIPRERLLMLARAMGHADIDQSKREATAGLTGADAAPITPGRKTIVEALGEPDHEKEIEPGLLRLDYDYHVVGPDGKLGKLSHILIELRGERLVRVALNTPRVNLWLKLTGD